MNREMEFQIECLTAELIRFLMDDYGWDMLRAMDELYASDADWLKHPPSPLPLRVKMRQTSGATMTPLFRLSFYKPKVL